jgi:hypothetical protein
MRTAWRTWLAALAVDAEAAVAAALVYESLTPEGRDAWLDALGEDAAGLGVPALSLYAPLLAVEEDEARRLRMTCALDACGGATVLRGERVSTLAFSGQARSGELVCLVVSPLYLDFVEVLVCHYRPDRGFLSARREPIRNVIDVIGRRLSGDSAPQTSLATSGCAATSAPGTCIIDGVVMAEAPLCDVVEDLAHAIVAERREGRAPPEALEAYAHLFVPDLARFDLQLDPQKCSVTASSLSVDAVPIAES